MTTEMIATMLKHLPPSGAFLRLLDIGGQCGPVFGQQREDLRITTIEGAAADWQFAPDSFDSVVAYDVAPDDTLLAAALHALRPGGRLIISMRGQRAEQQWVDLLQNAGYTRVMVESLVDAVLLRGEKPHTQVSTLDRMQQVAGQDTGLANFRGRYVHLLVYQTPNKPVWALQPDEAVTWQAVGVRDDDQIALLAFSSLPKAVAFMQPAVLAGLISGVNKVGKFSRETARQWSASILFNPEVETLVGREIRLWAVDPATAESPDE